MDSFSNDFLKRNLIALFITLDRDLSNGYHYLTVEQLEHVYNFRNVIK